MLKITRIPDGAKALGSTALFQTPLGAPFELGTRCEHCGARKQSCQRREKQSGLRCCERCKGKGSH